jgi:hypothetical protein
VRAEVLGSLARCFAWKSPPATCSENLPQKLADDGVDGLDDPKLLVVGLEVCLFVLEGVDVVVVMGLLGSFHPLPPIACAADHRSGRVPAMSILV